MRRNFSQDVSKMNRWRKRKKLWHKVVTVLVTIAVFCTTYALILPAITMEDETICGYIEHTHSNDCYSLLDETTDESSQMLICELPEHVHNESCYPVTESSEIQTESSDVTESQVDVETYASEYSETDNTDVSVETEATLNSTEFEYDATESEQETYSQQLTEETNVTQTETQKQGPMLMSNARATNQYQTVSLNSMDNTGEVSYVVYTKYNNRYYALDGNGSPVEITVNSSGAISSTVNNNMLWTFTSDGGASSYIIKNVGTGKYMHSYYNSANDKNVITSGAYSSALVSSGSGSNATFSVKSNANYSYMTQSGGRAAFSVTQTASQAAQYYIAALPQSQSTYHVWFDGTNSGIMSLLNSPNTYQAVPANNNTITLPTTWQSTTKYEYKLNGWYDIVTSTYYKPGATVTINQNTVFYADWVAKTYDVGQNNEHVVQSLDTNNFITTHVFDYNVLFNVQSLSYTGSISSKNHSEAWSLVETGKVPYKNANTLNFAFIDWDTDGPHFSYPTGLNTQNYNQGVITPGVLDNVKSVSGGVDLLDLLFNPNTEVIGKTYVGTGNYLYQYMDSTTDNYDGHDGYYYFNANLNAASYNQSQSRFYLYDYLERTSDSDKDGGDGTYSDFLPFNSPYANCNGKIVDTYKYYADGGKTGYEYDAKDGVSSYQQYNSPNHVTTNYFFGIRSDIDFYLPNNCGSKDSYGNYGNISTRGEHMVFEFYGDDDVWITVDGELMLDIGGLHGIEYGQIDFSTGVVTTNRGDDAVTQTFQQILGKNIEEGRHSLSIYYMERGSSQSNCAIYFNIAPRYDMEIKKEDIYTAELLDGTEFSVYSDEACTIPAELWHSYADYQVDIKDNKIDDSVNTFVVTDGYARCWGISAGKTYYIKETKPPEGYPETDDIIRITLNNRGFASIEITKINGKDGKFSSGYAVIEQEINETLKLVSLTFTNQLDGDTTAVRAQKTWHEDSANLPESITVFLTVDGEKVGRSAILHNGNGWTYTWMGLPKYDEDGNKIAYDVREVLVPGYETSQDDPIEVVEHEDWIRTSAMQDKGTYLLTNNDRALSFNGSSFTWISKEAAEGNKAAQWTVDTSTGGMRLTNGNNYTITFNNGRFTARNTINSSLNQNLYFVNSSLIALSNDLYYQFGENGTAVTSDGLSFTLYKHDVLTGFLVNVFNTPVDEEEQTFVRVNKEWADGKDHSDDSVVAKLFADGKDTGLSVTLNKDNNWSGSFEGLPSNTHNDDGSVKSQIKYTVVEEYLPGYSASYSDPLEIEGKKIVTWSHVNALEKDGVFRFIADGFALATNESGGLVSKANDVNDGYQHWVVVVSGNNLRLQNVESKMYLYVYSTTSWFNTTYHIGTTNKLNDASNVTINNGKLQVGGRYLKLTRDSISVESSANSGTLLSISQKSEISGKPGVGYTITNSISHVLPETGGIGVYIIYICGLLLIVGSLYLLYKKKGVANF